SLRTRALRWRPKWTPSDGVVDPHAVARAILAGQRLGARAYSPSALQQYAVCPYRFALHSMHRLRPREEAVALEQMDPLTRGALFHRAQFELFQDLARRGLLPLTADRLSTLLDLADAALDRVAAESEQKLAPAIPRVWRDEVDGLRTDLRGWVREAVHLEPWTPAHFELAFGLPREAGRDEASTETEARVLDGVRLRGSIDLVERNAASGALRVTDHKTGRALDPEPAYVGGGEALQPVLYALAIENLLGARVDSGRLFYCTQRGGYKQIEIPLDSRARQWTAQALLQIDRAIDQGFLPAAPKPKACERCDYHAVCGPYEEERIARKAEDERIEQLANLRRMP
ncbi:MAG: PD-(D/E)XK nuclease family protein, partial [Bryobacteraceae bacterium]